MFNACGMGVIRQVETWKGWNSQVQRDILALERTVDVLEFRVGPDSLNKELGTEGEANE